MKSTLEDLLARRSCRSYKPEQITDEELDAVLEAGMYAPTGIGKQSPVMVAVQDKATIAKLSKLNAAYSRNPDADPFYGAPTVIVVLADKNVHTHVYDGSCVMENLQVAAQALGLGSCWIHRAKEVFESDEARPCWSNGESRATTRASATACWAIGPARSPRPSPARTAMWSK